ncbi:MAG: type III pantothenate kinase [Polyangiaceae bacterium]|nr:type III pantothenate kinase [Polyangiaceae bacterium]
MLLTVDIGNTSVAFGLYEGKTLVQTFRAETVRERTSDEYGVLLRQMLRLKGIDDAKIAGAILASVVPPLTDVMVDAIRQAFAREPLVVGPGIKTGISVLYENPREVGADRIVNAVAAYDRVAQGVIVVDFGTATTFDCISPKGEYLGGVIVPGIQVSLEGLLARAAKLSRIEIAVPPRVVGRNTTHALQSGVVHGYAAMVDGLVEKIREDLGFPCRVMATGGLARLIAEQTTTLESVDEYLTLDGLRILHERNQESSSRGRPRPRSERADEK